MPWLLPRPPAIVSPRRSWDGGWGCRGETATRSGLGTGRLDRRQALAVRGAYTAFFSPDRSGAMGRLGRFRDVLEQGTFPEQKEFRRAFVAKITLHPVEMRGVLEMRDLAAANSCISGWSPSAAEKTSRASPGGASFCSIGWRGVEPLRRALLGIGWRGGGTREPIKNV